MARAPGRARINSSSAHVFTVLRFISGLEEALGVTEIARQLSLPASTVHRALVTLEEAGYIQRFQNVPRFELGTMPHLLNRALVTLFALHAAARDTLQALAQKTGETASIWARLGWYAVRIAGAYGNHDIYHRARLGETRLLHEGSGGLAMLAALHAEERSAYARFAGLEPAPAATPLAIALRDPAGSPIAALTIEEPIADGGAASLPAMLARTRDLLEALVAAEPDRFRSPFAHIAPDDIRLNLPQL
jgi:DNA-binding IclR family transcriptional regulator